MRLSELSTDAAASVLLSITPALSNILKDPDLRGKIGKRADLKDVSVMGMDGLPIGDYLVPQLTTIGQSVSSMARRSVEILLDGIEDGAQCRHETIPFRIYRRESVRELSE